MVEVAQHAILLFVRFFVEFFRQELVFLSYALPLVRAALSRCFFYSYLVPTHVSSFYFPTSNRFLSFLFSSINLFSCVTILWSSARLQAKSELDVFLFVGVALCTSLSFPTFSLSSDKFLWVVALCLLFLALFVSLRPKVQHQDLRINSSQRSAMHVLNFIVWTNRKEREKR